MTPWFAELIPSTLFGWLILIGSTLFVVAVLWRRFRESDAKA